MIAFFIILNHFLAKKRDLAKNYLIDIKENMYKKMHGEFQRHWYKNKAVIGIQMFVTDMTRKNPVFQNKKKDWPEFIPKSHITKFYST